MKILLLLLFPLAINCQTFIEGTIINKTTKQGIPYAIVGLINDFNNYKDYLETTLDVFKVNVLKKPAYATV